MDITVTIDDRLADQLRRGGEHAQRLMRDGLADIGDEFVQRAASLAGSGPFARSFSTSPAGDTVTAGSTSPMAKLIEHGRRPGRRPPGGDRRTIAGRGARMSNAAADRIAAQGTRGRFVVRRAAAEIRRDGTIDRIARRVVTDVANLEG